MILRCSQVDLTQTTSSRTDPSRRSNSNIKASNNTCKWQRSKTKKMSKMMRRKMTKRSRLQNYKREEAQVLNRDHSISRKVCRSKKLHKNRRDLQRKTKNKKKRRMATILIHQHIQTKKRTTSIVMSTPNLKMVMLAT